jgi:hypothetical protein
MTVATIFTGSDSLPHRATSSRSCFSIPRLHLLGSFLPVLGAQGKEAMAVPIQKGANDAYVWPPPAASLGSPAQW